MIVYSSENGHKLFVIFHFKVIKTICEPISGNGELYWIRSLPQFDIEKYPFLLVSGAKSFSLINVKTGTIEGMIQGSPKTTKDMQAAFFVPLKNGFELHFTTRERLQNKLVEYNYYVMHYKPGFLDILREFGKLPYDSIIKPLQTIQTLEKKC